MTPLKIQIGKSLQGKTISGILPERIKGFSKRRLEVAYHKGLILLNGEAVKTDCRVQLDDVLEADIAYFFKSKVFPEKLPLHILFEDDHLLVINKQSGMACHAGLGVYKGTLLNALSYHYARQGEKNLENGLVQRLDRQTCGLMVVAKTTDAFRGLKEQIDSRSLKRVYLAEAWGSPRFSSGVINDPMGRIPGNEDHIGIHSDGKEAITEYRVLEEKKGTSLIECVLQTGRTHQIRIHLSQSLGCPILGDRRYGSPDAYNVLHLCSVEIRFVHPLNGKEMFFRLEKPCFL